MPCGGQVLAGCALGPPAGHGDLQPSATPVRHRSNMKRCRWRARAPDEDPEGRLRLCPADQTIRPAFAEMPWEERRSTGMKPSLSDFGAVIRGCSIVIMSSHTPSGRHPQHTRSRAGSAHSHSCLRPVPESVHRVSSDLQIGVVVRPAMLLIQRPALRLSPECAPGRQFRLGADGSG
jgi:hypothetical protein